MNIELSKAVLHLIESHPVLSQRGQPAGMTEMESLNRECGGVIPEWLIEFMTTYPLCGADLGIEDPDAEEFEPAAWTSRLLYFAKRDQYPQLAWVEWSTPTVMRSAMLENAIGMALLKRGFINVAHDGSTCDPWFVPTDRGDNPPLFAISVCASAGTDSELMDELELVCGKLSELFLKIKAVQLP